MPQTPDVTEMIGQRLKQAVRLIEYDLPRMVGKTARDHFRDNFRQGGFVNGGLHRWKDVKRRDPDSKWYGFEYKAEKRTSYKFKRDPKTGRTRKADKQKQLNFSPTATRRPVLLSKRLELMRSITSRPGRGCRRTEPRGDHKSVRQTSGEATRQTIYRREQGTGK